MAAVWEQRWSNFVRRCLALRESTALEALPDLMPSLVVNDPAAPESWLMRGDRVCHGHVVQPGVAAQYSRLAFVNPAGSGKLVVLDRWTISNEAGALAIRVQVGWVPWAAITGSTNSFSDYADFRSLPTSGSVAPPVAYLRHDSNAATFSLPTQILLTGGAGYVGHQTREEPFILPPASAIGFASNVVNTPLSVGVRWRERTVDAGELNPGS